VEPPVLAALIAASASIVLGVWNVITTRINNRALQDLKREGDEQLAYLNAELGRQRASDDARLSYEFSARRRLYEELEPLTFQLVDAADSAYVRISDLARAGRDGRLDGPDGWLADRQDAYFLVSTVYRLTTPMALLRIWHRRLTLIDLSLDYLIAYRYVLGRLLSLTFSEDHFLAASPPALPYNPTSAGARKHRRPGQEQQGIYIGRVEAAVDAMLVREDERLRVMTFAEFETGLADTRSELHMRMGPFMDLFTGFHPARRPVAWRILVAQAHLHRALFTTRRPPDEGPKGVTEALVIPDADRTPFDWRDAQHLHRVPDADVLRAPFEAAVSRLATQVERNLALLRGL
jgi:hypothetical protein